MRVTFTSLSDIGTATWEAARTPLIDDLIRLQSTINKTWDVAHHADGTQRAGTRGSELGQISGTLAEQPTGLTTEDDGLLYFVTDYGHLVRWNGSTLAWGFAPGDPGSGYFADFAITPQATGWALCDGSATTYLTVGTGTLGSASITLPNLTATPAYRKAAAAYTGTIIAAAGSSSSDGAHTHTISGSSASNGAHTHTVSGSTANESAHTHGAGTLAVPAFQTSITVTSPGGATTYDNTLPNAVGGTTGAGSAHAHGAGTLAADSNGAHTHGAGTYAADSNGAHTHSLGTIDPTHLNVLPYFRR